MCLKTRTTLGKSLMQPCRSFYSLQSIKPNIFSTDKDYPPVIARVFSEAIPKTETASLTLAMTVCLSLGGVRNEVQNHEVISKTKITSLIRSSQ
ncbi:MAG: hypothetical protein ACUBOA_02760 [Candidatus Loosdrechtia sp.]|uniref:hypothetical protein n=1 Tax=Candidatus Loosdrechtia sp. TaxID=3101272 RepID=UPI003A766911|nr:MAG: hypothetical protein QY305_02145 [Candidatus Jettenia sp. AMX2]